MRRLWENKVQLLAVLGGALIIVSIAFEYVRNKPAFAQLVFPWSIRGYELTRGWVFAAAGVVLIVIALMDSQTKPLLWLRRIHLAAAVFAFLVITFSAGSLRSSLVAEQMRTLQVPTTGEPFSGVAAPYKDVQITSGWMIAVAGAVVAFLGAVGMWASRRDQRKAQMRAARQLEAAQDSARELEEASA